MIKEQEQKEHRLFISPMQSLPGHISDNGYIYLQVFIEQPLLHGSRSDQYLVPVSPFFLSSLGLGAAKALVLVAWQSIAVPLNHAYIL